MLKFTNYNTKVHRSFHRLAEAPYPWRLPIQKSVYDSLVSAVNSILPLLQRYIAFEQRF